jgi:hypothetical protein
MIDRLVRHADWSPSAATPTGSKTETSNALSTRPTMTNHQPGSQFSVAIDTRRVKLLTDAQHELSGVGLVY